MGIPGRHGLRGVEHGAMRLLRRGVVGRDERLDIITLMMPVSQEGPGAVSRLDFVAGWVVSGSRKLASCEARRKWLPPSVPFVNPSLSQSPLGMNLEALESSRLAAMATTGIPCCRLFGGTIAVTGP